MSAIATALVNGLALGSVYALFSLGISLVFGVMRLVNFGYAALIMFGAYTLASASALPVPVQLLLAVATPVAVSLISERVIFRPLRGADEVTLLIASFALNALLQGIISSVFGTAAKGVRLPLFEGSFRVAGVTIATIDIMTILVTVVMLVSLVIFLGRHPLGVQMRAAAEDLSMSRMVGVRANTVIALSFAIAGVLAGISSIFLVGRTGNTTIDVGINAIFYGFVGAVLGRLGSLPGAVLAGYLLGMLSVVLQIVLPSGAASYRDAILFGLVFAFLVVRPQGLLRRVAGERV